MLCRFTRNGGFGAGAGLFLFTGITGTMSGCHFSNNLQPNAMGAGLLVVSLTNFDIRRTIFTNNTGALVFFLMTVKRVILTTWLGNGL